MNVPPTTALSFPAEREPATSLDDCEEDCGDEEAFHQVVGAVEWYAKGGCYTLASGDAHLPQQKQLP